MNFEVDKVRVPLWLLLTVAIAAASIGLGYWYYKIDPNNTKLLGFVGGIVTGLIVYLATFLTLLRPIQELDRFRRMGVKALLANRHDQNYYRSLVVRSKRRVDVMGASCSRFVQDFLDTESDDKVLVDALFKYSKLKVRLLIPDEKHMGDDAKNRSCGMISKIAALQKQFDGRVELRRFSDHAHHSFVLVDNDLVAGPIFEGDKVAMPPQYMSQLRRYLAKNTTTTLKQFGSPVARMREVQIQARPRLHLGLLSLHEGALRKNGGIGFAIEGPTAEIEIREGPQLTIYDNRAQPMTDGELAFLRGLLEHFALNHAMTRRGVIRIRGGMRTHVGMGSATAIRLGAMEALALINQTHIGTDQLIAASGRGGTSGIGINTYFSGGLVCDLGQRPDSAPYLPSSRTMPIRLPLALPVVPMPPWPILLCVPRSIAPKSQQEEIAFFERTTPLPASASFEASYIALFGIYAAVVEGNYPAFCQSVTLMQETAWKNAERAEYGQPLRDLSTKLLDVGADCVGMSSLGPMLFCFAEPSRIATVAGRAKALDCDVYPTSPANTGRSLMKIDA